ncbi:MAG: hypothetical protein GY901_00475, partial [Actinomycetia bacterium]|nr:hypothetical protein [Actinomycetes bacterium]
GPGLVISPNPVILSASALTTVQVHLATQPLHPGNVTVSVDSSLAAGAVAVSTCSLTFNSTNWNISQTVVITPRLSAFTQGQQTFGVVFRAFNYTRTFSWGEGVAVTGNDTVVIDPATGLPIADQSAYRLGEGDTDQAVVETLPVTVQYSGGGSGTCRSWGDPHFVTWSSNKWNFYGTGDFYLARSCDGEFVVQTRQEQCFTVSCNTAVVVKYRNSIVAFNLDARTSPDPVIVLSPTFNDGVQIFRLNAQAGLPAYRITLPNGGFVEFRASGWRNRHYINVDIKVPS